MNRADPEHKTLDGDLFPLDEPFLRVRISNAKNYLAVENFRSSFSKLLTIYNQKVDELVEFYRKFIPNFAEESVKTRSKSRERLKDIAPEVFLPLYTKRCKKKPAIAGKEEALEIPEGERMLFPATPEEGKQNYYICPHNPERYPGLLVNTLGNRDKFPYLPCCYKKDRRYVKNSNYRKYFFSEEEQAEETGEKLQQTVFLTGKMATSSGFGTLPVALEQLFRLIDTDSIYYRKGVARSQGSFLECVMEALHGETDFLVPNKSGSLTDKQRKIRVNKMRKVISEWNGLSVGRQELYDALAQDISKDLENPKVYLNPKKYVRILEAYFDCNIFLFAKDNTSGRMVLPRFSQAYLRYPLRERPTVLIYEHWGGKAEALTYPQCEIIVRWDGEQDYPTYALEYAEPAVQRINEISERLRKVYNFDLVPPAFLPNLHKLDLKSQVIDSYGKTRVINLNYAGTLYSIITEPIPPMNLQEEALKYNLWPLKAATKFVAEMGLMVLKQNIHQEKLKEIHVKFGSIEIILPIKNGTPLQNIKVINQPPFVSAGTVSNFLKFNYLKKTARYLTEYFIYSFSIYLEENEITEVTSEVLQNFIEEKVVVIENYVYENIDRNFSTSSGVFQGGKIVVPSEEAIRRLLYVLRLNLQQRFSEVLNYKNRRNIKNYYVDVTDFDVRPEQIILQGRDSLKKWIENPENLNVLHREVTFEPNQTYFFKNKNAGEGLYIAQNTDKFKEGVNIGKTWAIENYNPVTEEEDREGLAFKLLSVHSKNEIKEYSVRGKQNAYNLKLLGYKKDGESKFTVLLPLEND